MRTNKLRFKNHACTRLICIFVIIVRLPLLNKELLTYFCAPESHPGLHSLAYQSTCSQSGRLLQRSSGWPATDSDQQASIHCPCSSSPCAAATRLGQCLESDACAAPLAFHFHSRGFSSSCARWCTCVFTTRRLHGSPNHIAVMGSRFGIIHFNFLCFPFLKSGALLLC